MSTLSDGSVAFGSQILAIGAVNYIAETIDVSRGVTLTDMPDANKVPTKGSFVKGRMSGTATLQLPSTTAAPPAVGADVSIVPIGGGAARPFFITSVGEMIRAEGIKKVNVGLAEKLDGNPIVEPVWYDGNTSLAQAAGPMLTWFDHIIGIYEYRQLWVVHGDFWQATAMQEDCPANAAAKFIEESKPSEFGAGGLVSWEKVWITFPPDRNEAGTAVKTYKKIYKQAVNGIMSDAVVVARSQAVKVTIGYHYSRNPSSLSVPGVPDAAIVHGTGGYKWIERYNGFPGSDNIGGATSLGIDNNSSPGWLGGEVTLWRGDIYQQRQIYG